MKPSGISSQILLILTSDPLLKETVLGFFDFAGIIDMGYKKTNR
jgi:hypothetical protein